MYSSLDHLSSEEIMQIKKRYYQGESVYQLTAEYKLKIAPSMFYKLLPPETSDQYFCAKCNVNLVTDPLPRTKHSKKGASPSYFCPICKRKLSLTRSDKLIKTAFITAEQKSKQQEIKNYYQRAHTPVRYDDLSLTQKIYLAALCSKVLDHDQKTILPSNNVHTLLADTPDLTKKLYSALLKSHVLVVNPESSVEAFDPDEAHFPKKYDREKVSYTLNLTLPAGYNNIIDVNNSLCNTCADHDPEILALWREIAVGECISYLQYRLDRIHFPFSPGKKTYATFQILLNSFSVSQIYYIIWCKVNDISRWYLEVHIAPLNSRQCGAKQPQCVGEQPG